MRCLRRALFTVVAVSTRALAPGPYAQGQCKTLTTFAIATKDNPRM
jgi:hypothetical protein